MLSLQERDGILQEMGVQLLQAGIGAGATVFDWMGGLHGPRIESHPVFATWASNILRYCERSGWIFNPMLLLELMDKVAKAPRTPFGPQIPTLKAQLVATAPPIYWPEGRAFDTFQLSVALPFLNRAITRRAFEDFDNPLQGGGQPARVLVVNGPPGSGKTFTGSFLRLLVGLRPAEQYGIAELDFKSWTGVPLTPDRLVVHLMTQMGIPKEQAEAEVPPVGNQRPERWAKRLVLWLVNTAIRTTKTWCILLDNFHLAGVPEATHIFIEQLLVALADKPLAWDMQDETMGPSLRLVLLGYTRSISDRWPWVRREDIQPISKEDLRVHFERYFRYKQWSVDAGRIDTIVARYESRLPSLFPPAVATAVGTAATSSTRWKMLELAEVVLRDREKIDQ